MLSQRFQVFKDKTFFCVRFVCGRLWRICFSLCRVLLHRRDFSHHYGHQHTESAHNNVLRGYAVSLSLSLSLSLDEQVCDNFELQIDAHAF